MAAAARSLTPRRAKAEPAKPAAPKRRMGRAENMPSAIEAGDDQIPLSNRSMTVRLSTHQWTAQKQDRKIAAEVAKAKKTEESRHKHTRVLLADQALKDINNAIGAAERFHLMHSSPWDDGGVRIISNRRYSAYMDGIAALQRAVEEAVAKFTAVYPQLVAHERANNPFFVESDYPPVSEIKGRFGIEVVHGYVAAKGDFRAVGISAADNARIQQEIEDRTNDRLKGVVADIWKRVHEAVNHVSERLKAYDEREERLAEAQEQANRRRGKNKGKRTGADKRTGIFHDTLIDNVKELIAVIPDLDLTDDPEVSAIRTKMLNQLCVHDADALRKSGPLRQRVTENADKLLVDINKQIEAIGDFL